MGLTRPTFAQIRGASSAVDTVSDSTSVLSQQISVLSSRVADNSAQMISADNAISNAVSVVSAQLASVDTKLSNAVSVVSAAAASIESHVNTVSNAVSVVSAQVATNSAQMTSADNAISNAVSVVSAAVVSVSAVLQNAISNEVSNRQSASAALESHINTVSNAVSVVSAAVVSVSAVLQNAISNETSARVAASADLKSAINVVSDAVSIVSAQLVSVDSKLSNAISALSNAISSTYAKKSGATFTGDVVVSATLSVIGATVFAGTVNVATVGGDEGGEILLGKPVTNTTLVGTGITIDVYQNRLRFFEQGGTARGAYIDFTSAGSGVGTNLLAAGGGGGTTSVASADLASVENKLSNLVSVVSAAAASVETHVNTVSNAVSTVSAAQLSTWNAISNEISVRAAASADLKSAINVVSNAVSVVSAQVATNSAQMTSANNAISNAVSVVSAAQLSTWNKVSAILTSSQTFSGSTYGFSNTLQRNSRNVVTNYTGVSAPSTPLVGDEWYYTTSDILYKYIYDGTNYAWVDLTSPLYNTATAATANTIALRDSGGNLTATNFLGVASSAKYADLAEIYTSDYDYTAGTVVVLDGPAEITQSTHSHDTRIAGVISDKPAYLMNSEAKGLPVALMGRVPCQVTGTVTKGDRLVASYKPGHAMSMNPNLYEPGCIIGKALEDFTGESGTIEIMVGRT